MHDYSKICRVCMTSGSRDIFHRSNIDPNNPLDRLLEKMRYVTMMKIEENDDLPRLICDLCTVQLNVAYNFKRQAVENDTKLRQYFIENGIISHHSNVNGDSPSSPNTVISPASTINSNLNNINNINLSSNNINGNKSGNSNNAETSSRSTFSPAKSAAILPIARRETNCFPIMPIIVKTEPENDLIADDLSDSVLDHNINQQEQLTESSISTTNIVSNCNRTSLMNSSSMVYLNGYNINTLTPSSEVESYHNIGSGNRIISDDVLQLSSGSSSLSDPSQQINISNTSENQKNSSNSIDTKESKKSLSPAEIARKRIAQKRLGNQLKTRRVVPERKQKKNLETSLKIDMAPPSGKISRAEMKKNLYFGTEKKQREIIEKSDSTSTDIKSKRKTNKLNLTILLNPFNNRKQLSPDSLKNKNNTKKNELQSIKANRSEQSFLKGSKKTTGRSAKKSLADVQGLQTKLLKPKIEPISKN